MIAPRSSDPNRVGHNRSLWLSISRTEVCSSPLFLKESDCGEAEWWRPDQLKTSPFSRSTADPGRLQHCGGQIGSLDRNVCDSKRPDSVLESYTDIFSFFSHDLNIHL